MSKIKVERVEKPKHVKKAIKTAKPKPKTEVKTEVIVKGEPVYTDYAFDICLDPKTKEQQFVVIKYNLKTGDCVVDATGNLNNKKLSLLFTNKKRALGRILNLEQLEE